MVARRRRRELFPPDRRLQTRMAVTALLTPAVVLALAAAVLLYAPHRLLAGLAIATAVGTFVAVRERRRHESARVLLADERPELHAKVERLCVLADLPRPYIVVDDEVQPNSWVVDLPGARPRLHLTRGLLEALTPVEIEAVIAHELAHVGNHEATVVTIVGGAGTVLLEGGRAVSGRGGWWVLQIGAVVAAVIGAIAQIGTNTLSRYRELAADAGAAALTGHPAALASALVKVSGGLSRLPTEDLRL